VRTAIERSIRIPARATSARPERHRIELEPVVHQPIAEPPGDLGLQPLDLLGLEFDHLAGAQVDQVVVMRVGDMLVARASLAEVMPLDDAGILEQLDRAVDGRDRDVRIDLDAAAVQLLDIRMIVGARQHARDHPALLGHPHALGDALRLDEVQFLRGQDHDPSLCFRVFPGEPAL
jgi:hypothetical protein